MKNDEGYIKFYLDWAEVSAMQPVMIEEINFYRTKLYKLGLIGQTADGIGFGNISIRTDKNKFLVSGSQTGGIPILGTQHYTIVEKFDIARNKVWCRGPVKASSESLAHAAVYFYSHSNDSQPNDSQSNAVIHVHHLAAWTKYLNKLPTTDKSVPYGTPEMAYEIKRILSPGNNQPANVIIMGGHESGIIIHGNSAEETFRKVKGLLI